MNQVTTTTEQKPLVVLNTQLEQRAAEFAKALPSHIPPEKFQRTVLTAAQTNPTLLGADRQSFIVACMKAAQDGLLPDGREAALVIFETRFKDPETQQWSSRAVVQYMPMVYGLRKKILQSGEISALEVNVVYRAEVAGGAFFYEVGMNPPLRHRPSLDLTAEQAQDSEIVAAYSIATFRDGTKSYELMRRFEIDQVREVSKTGATHDRYGKPREAKGPWVDWFAEMAKKTVMRRHSKTLPMSGDIVDVEARDDTMLAASATGVLGAVAGSQPQLIEQAEAPEVEHDLETGEIKGETEVEGTEAPDLRTEVDEQTGTTRHPAEEAAEKIIAELREQIAIIDLNSVFARYRKDVEAMPEEIAQVISAAKERRKGEIEAARKAEKAQKVDA